MITEEVDAYEVLLIDKNSNDILDLFDAEDDYDLAVKTKDSWDLEFNDGTTYTKIEVYSLEI